MERRDRDALRAELRSAVKGEVTQDPVTLGIYSTDASIYQVTPVAVVLPRDSADVEAAVRVAAARGVPILPRGGGTSLAGQTVGPCIVVDFSKHMNRLLELNVAERWARVQPGIVLDELNAVLAQHGLHFAPDPATSSRATVGGMIGNNSAGTKSIVYGLTQRHVKEIDALLVDGTRLRLGLVSPEERDAARAGAAGRSDAIIAGVARIVGAHRERIIERYPKVMRSVQGYNLDAFVGDGPWNLAELVVGSEGTLCLTLEAKINLEPLPRHKALCPVHFADLMEAIRSVAPILAHGPSAVELLDGKVIAMARENLSIAPLCAFMQGDPHAILIVEFFGNSAEEVARKAAALGDDLAEKRLGYAWPVIADPAGQAKVWTVRKNGLGLMLGIKGHRKPLPFIEDCAIPVDVLPAYIDEILAFCAARDVAVAMYAHASVGVIHVRPVLDLRQVQDIAYLKEISSYALGRVMHYRGAWSGEHGDGRVRSPALETFFGPEIYGALREVKRLFDPRGLLNPGVIVDPAPMDQNLRYGASYRSPAFPTAYHYREDGSFAAAVEMCTGVGACRQKLSGTMCPSYRATMDEAHSTRGRANALRLAMTGQLGPDGLASRGLFEVLDLCLSCKACKAECPSNVDMARLKGEFLQSYHDKHGLSFRERLTGRFPAMARRYSGALAPIVNAVLRSAPARWILALIAGVHPGRVLPAYAREPFVRWFDRRDGATRAAAGTGPARDPRPSARRTVVLFEDTYLNYHEPRIGIAAVELLESCGYTVELARAGCCQRPAISQGMLRDARAAGLATLRNLDAFIRGGLPVVVCEPSCASALTDDLPDLADDAALAKRIKGGVMMIDDFLASELRTGALKADFTSPYGKVLVHGHCHHKSLFGTASMETLLRRVPGLGVEMLDAGCCGMAGSFGYEKEHFALSMKIGEDRLFPAIRARGRDTAVVATGFSCRHQIADGTGARAVHWVEAIRGAAAEGQAAASGAKS